MVVRISSIYQIELFDDINVYKKIDVKLNCLCYIEILETLWLYVNKYIDVR